MFLGSTYDDLQQFSNKRSLGRNSVTSRPPILLQKQCVTLLRLIRFSTSAIVRHFISVSINLYTEISHLCFRSLDYIISFCIFVDAQFTTYKVEQRANKVRKGFKGLYVCQPNGSLCKVWAFTGLYKFAGDSSRFCRPIISCAI